MTLRFSLVFPAQTAVRAFTDRDRDATIATTP